MLMPQTIKPDTTDVYEIFTGLHIASNKFHILKRLNGESNFKDWGTIFNKLKSNNDYTDIASYDVNYLRSEKKWIELLNADLSNAENHINAINLFNKTVFRLAGEAHHFIANNEPVFKNDFTMVKRYKDKLDKIIEPYLINDQLKIHSSSDFNSLEIYCKIYYKIGLNNTAGYIEEYIHLFLPNYGAQEKNRFKPVKTLTVNAYYRAIKTISKNKAKIRKIARINNNLKQKYDLN